MTRAEYLEALQEDQVILTSQANAEAQGAYGRDPRRMLFDTPEVCRALQQAHRQYCERVAGIFGIDLGYHEAGGPPSQTLLSAINQLREDLRPDPVDLEPLF